MFKSVLLIKIHVHASVNKIIINTEQLWGANQLVNMFTITCILLTGGTAELVKVDDEIMTDNRIVLHVSSLNIMDFITVMQDYKPAIFEDKKHLVQTCNSTVHHRVFNQVYATHSSFECIFT